jgi:hypothetical protein
MPAREMGTQFKRMTDSFEAQRDSYAELQSSPTFILATPGGLRWGPITLTDSEPDKRSLY